MASGKNTLSSIILFIAALGIAVRFFGAFLQLVIALGNALEKAEAPEKEEG